MSPIQVILGSLALVLPAFGRELVDLSADLRPILADSGLPSLAAAAVVDGEIMAAGATGLRKAGEPVKVTVEDRYHIGSCTKSMTAVLAAKWVEDDQLSWDTTVSTVFPMIKIHPGYRDVTLRQLLSHAGGTPGSIEPELWKNLWANRGTAVEQRRQLVKGVLGREPDYAPGSRQRYSNAGFAIAGAMIEATADKPYEDLLRDQLFSPLAMNSAGFRAPATNGKIDQPYGHQLIEGKLVAFDPEPRGDNPRAIIPAGGVHCSVIDLARYARFHLGRAGERILTPKSRKILYEADPGNDFALGWVVTERAWAGGRALTHTGSNTMFFAVIWLAPENDFAAVALCNCGGEEAFRKCDEVIALLVQRYQSPKPSTPARK